MTPTRAAMVMTMVMIWPIGRLLRRAILALDGKVAQADAHAAHAAPGVDLGHEGGAHAGAGAGSAIGEPEADAVAGVKAVAQRHLQVVVADDAGALERDAARGQHRLGITDAEGLEAAQLFGEQLVD